MHQDPIFKGRSLGFSSDLSIAAPLKRGLVPALDAVSYKTRAQRLLDTLHLGRMRNHEHAYARLFSDAVERVGVIQSVRVAVLEPEDKLLLTVSFDGNWDAYIRTLWVKVGGLLDVIFCNTEGYVEARLHPCEAWAEWVRTHQVQTHFFYGSTDGSATDLLYLRRQERLRQDRAASDPEPPPGMLPRAEQRAREMLDMTDETIADAQWPRNEQMVSTMLRQGLQALAALHRLADWYVPGTPDGEVLHRAAHELLQDFVQAWGRNLFRLAIEDTRTRLLERFGRQLEWLRRQPGPARVPLGGGELDEVDKPDIQGGILEGFSDITHGALLLYAWDDARAGARFLQSVQGRLSTAAQGPEVGQGETRLTLYLTLAGLRRLGLGHPEVETLPEAFVQGMAARAGLLGDRHDNHPERWSPPLRHDPSGPPGRIDLDAVHVVLHLRVNGPGDSMAQWALEEGHPLWNAVQALQAPAPGATLLAVEPLRRLYKDGDRRKGIEEHFGFQDGNGQPGLAGSTKSEDYPGNHQPAGEFLLGHPGRGDVRPIEGVAPRPHTQPPDWLRNSSFLVVRKYRQWPDLFEKVLARAEKETGIRADAVAARLMGRDRQGHPLVRPGSNTNQFTYLADPTGRRCPLHAHVRRANPRRLAHETAPGEREPRILRRSMSFGPRQGESGPEAERGLMFMAFNADIAEQFEVVQRWLAGGHATDTSSGIACPIVGVPEPGRPRRYEFEHQGRLARITLDGEGTLLGDAAPLVRLEWGAYWLAPSLGAIRHLVDEVARRTGAAAAPRCPFSAKRGAELIQALHAGPDQAADWKAVLEDAESTRRFDAASLWAAVRQQPGGAMRCPMGVLVASPEAVAGLLRDDQKLTTVAGYAERMHGAMGPIFLGLDDREGSRYREEAQPVREAIEQLPVQQAFDVARGAVTQRLQDLVDGAKAQARMAGDPVFELVFNDHELVDEVLARLCEAWFGLRVPDPASTDEAFFERGGFRWSAPGDKPRYPGHFMAPSRYLFQPRPEATVRDTGQQHARQLKKAMLDFLAASKVSPLVDPATGKAAPVGRAIVDHPLSRQDADFAARTMVGAIMGFVPTMDGALRAVLSEWRRTGEWARLRHRRRDKDFDDALRLAMERALQLRSVPDLVWRRAATDFDLGHGLWVEKDETLILGLGSAAQAAYEQGRLDDTHAMFGGRRGAAERPTHACPGYQAALAAMRGALGAIVESPWPLQALPGSTAWRISGESGFVPPPAAPPGSFRRTAEVQPADRRTVLCWGDSWLDYREVLQFGKRVDMLQALHEDHPLFRMEGRGGFASYARWGYIAAMKEGLERFLDELRARLDLGEPPHAILLSGGGNDSTGERLLPLLARYEAKPAAGTRLTAAAAEHVRELQGHYRVVLDGIRQTCAQAVGGPVWVPVLMHGYDHPFPGHGIAAWLWKAFKDAGYPDGATGQRHAAEAMQELIDGLNKAQIELTEDQQLKGMAFHVELRETFAKASPGNPSSWWSNELHPTEAGFRLVADKVAASLKALTDRSAQVRAVATGS